MKHSILSVLIGSLLLVGCGGGSSDNSTSTPSKDNGTQEPSGQSNSLTITQVNVISGIALREALLSGLVDTLISGTDEALDGTPCKTGSMTHSGNNYNFNACEGIYEAKASGQVTVVGDSYTYKDLTLTFPNGETQKINGDLQILESSTNVTAKSSQIVLDAQELNSSKKLIPTHYTFSDYQLVWTPSDASHVQLKISAKLKSTGREDGDFNIAFDNFMTAFNVQKNADDDLVGYPYDGTLIISDLNQSKNKITIKAIGINQKAQYTAAGDQNFDKQIAWDELLDY